MSKETKQRQLQKNGGGGRGEQCNKPAQTTTENQCYKLRTGPNSFPKTNTLTLRAAVTCCLHIIFARTRSSPAGGVSFQIVFERMTSFQATHSYNPKPPNHFTQPPKPASPCASRGKKELPRKTQQAMPRLRLDLTPDSEQKRQPAHNKQEYQKSPKTNQVSPSLCTRHRASFSPPPPPSISPPSKQSVLALLDSFRQGLG